MGTATHYQPNAECVYHLTKKYTEDISHYDSIPLQHMTAKNSVETSQIPLGHLLLLQSFLYFLVNVLHFLKGFLTFSIFGEFILTPQ